MFQGSRRSRELAWWRRQLLHPTVAAKVVGAFVRRECDTAVFQAFKEVEVAVRAKGKSPDTEVGVPLMRRAFDPKAGPLRDQNAVEAEREATAHLFAGAMGSFKNPHSHRNVPITDPAEAVELLLLASRLLRISTLGCRVVERRGRAGPTGSLRTRAATTVTRGLATTIANILVEPSTKQRNSEPAGTRL